MKMEFSAGGVVFRKAGQNTEFALILNSYDQWTFPKGHIEKGEKPEAAALREVAEELGLERLEVISQIDKIDYWFKLDNVLTHKFVYFYLMRADASQKLNFQASEIKAAEWLSFEEANSRLKYKEDIPLLKKSLELIDKVS